MNDKNITLKIVDFKNAQEAIEVQRTIFLPEDGLLNVLASLDRDLFIRETGLAYPDDKVKYYLAYKDNEPIGLTGLYEEPGIDDEMWLAWFGVLPKYRKLGYGTTILNLSIKEVLNKGKKVLRLYTDAVGNASAIELYKKMGFIGEKYTAEELRYDGYIYSKNLVGEQVSLWNNRNLDLTQQSAFESIDEDFKESLYKKYKDNYLK